MPYDSVSDLPASVRDNLPKHAREVYLAAYNNAWEEYKNAEDRKGALPERRLHIKLRGVPSKISMRRRKMEPGKVRTKLNQKEK